MSGVKLRTMKGPKLATPGISRAGRLRAYLAGTIVTLGILGVASRAYSLQIDEGAKFAEQAAKQHALTVVIPGPRGEIVDAHGQPLAVSADTDSIWANPRDIHDVTETSARLAAILNTLGAARRFGWIERHVTPESARAVKAAKLAGVEVAREPRRWYPSRTIAGPVVGRADIDGLGLDGIELAMNDLLTGKRNAAHALRDARGRRMFADGVAPPDAGATVQLTLDRSIQAISDQALADAVTVHQAKNGVVVVLDVATGKVLALSAYPTSDPNGDGAPARNRPITDAYEAGSVMKVFTVASALDEGLITPDTGFDLSPIAVAPKVRDVHFDPYLTTTEIIKRSSNIGAAKIALRLGRDKLHDRLARFGFGIKTGIELPGEVGGRVRPGNTWRDIELATIAFGYGITVTPLQIAAGLAALGNGGLYHAPRIVEQAVDPDGTVLYASPPEERRVVSAKTAGQMMTILESVFDKDPTGKKSGTAAGIVVPGFQCAGKTGTAHKWDAEARKYADHRYLSSFAGLAPAKHPRLAIVVLIDEPSGGDYFGGKVAGPVFATVASETLRYLGVPGTAMPPPMVIGDDGIARPAPTPRSTAAEIATALASSTLSPAAWAEVPAPVAVVLAPGQRAVPAFVDLGYARALELARASNLAIDVEGSGRVISQDPPPGPAPIGTRVKLRFSDGD
ncbi:MAG: penicillin-binding transpeptidase domain-containing protein [Proteobacteria bacterium]|nr:penicillin-binding transpeptidase domain-containing protein [Pseudomonadota bacterium]